MRRLGLVLCATLLWSACSDDGGSEDPSDSIGIDDGARKGEIKRAVVERATTAKIQMSTGASLSIPAGAARERVTITMERMPDDQAQPLAARAAATTRLASAPYRLTPHATRFDQPLELTLPISRGDYARIRVAVLDDENDQTWEFAAARAGATAGSVVTDLTHFSIWALFEDTSQPSVMDGGSDASSDAGVMDAFVIREAAIESDGNLLPPDASLRDADVAVDAATQDASTNNFVGRVLQRLDECQMVGNDGLYNDRFATTVFRDAFQRCEAQCFLDASCEDFVHTPGLCGYTDYPPKVSACIQGCFGRAPEYACMAVTGAPTTGYSCSGSLECADGSDEVGCAAAPVCADGQTPRVLQLCDGRQDCRDGSDESGCPTLFPCADQSGSIPDTQKCDGFKQCPDASDEANDCLEVLCPIITTTTGT